LLFEVVSLSLSHLQWWMGFRGRYICHDGKNIKLSALLDEEGISPFFPFTPPTPTQAIPPLQTNYIKSSVLYGGLHTSLSALDRSRLLHESQRGVFSEVFSLSFPLYPPPPSSTRNKSSLLMKTLLKTGRGARGSTQRRVRSNATDTTCPQSGTLVLISQVLSLSLSRCLSPSPPHS